MENPSNNNNQGLEARTFSFPYCSRLLVSLILCLIATIGAQAQSVSFSASSDGKDLVITATGNLTNYKFVDTSYQVFTSEGAANVSPNSWGGNTEGTKYDPSTTYYYKNGYSWTQITDNTTYFSEHSGYLKTNDKSVDFVTALEEQMTSGGYTSFHFAQGDGDAIVLSATQVQTLLNDMTSKNTAILCDFAAVTGISADEMPTGPTSYSSVSWVLPNSLTDAEKATVGAKATTTNVMWFSFLNSTTNEPTVNIHVLNQNQLSFLSQAVATENSLLSPKFIVNMVVTGTINLGSDATAAATLLKNFDITNTDNLDLHNATVYGTPTPLLFDGFTHLNRVIWPKNSVDMSTWYTNSDYQDYIKNTTNTCKIFQMIKSDSQGNNVFQSLVMNTGRLQMTEHYYNEDFAKCVCVDFYGILNDDDVDFLQKVQTPRLNLAHATWSGESTNLMNFRTNQDMLRYLALPDLNAEASNFSTIINNNPKLLGVGQFNSTTGLFCGALQNRENEKAEGTMNILTLMIDHVSDYTKIKLSGDLNAADITNNADKGYIDESYPCHLSTSGHWTTKDASDYASTQTGALNLCGQLTSIDFSDARFAENTDCNPAFAGLISSGTLSEVLLPTDKNFKEIGPYALNNMGSAIKTLTIPGNVQILDAGFLKLNSQIHNIKTTKTDTNGNGSYASDMIIDNGDWSFTLPAGLTQIHKEAFAGDDWIHDVYSLNPVAPKCDRDAFGSYTYTGNNGFDATNGVNEKAYIKDNANSYAVLHYPSTVDEENLKKYTDPTRVYTLEDNTHATDAEGNLLHWPSQTEWNHAYITAYTGYTWEAWDKSKTKWTFSDCKETTNTDGTVTVAPDVSSVVTDNTKTYDQDYTGWHQFVLANAMNSKKDMDDPVRNFSRFKQNDWYSICVPYNIKKSDLQRLFGVTADEANETRTVTLANGKTVDVPATGLYPDVVTLTAVTRDASSNTVTLTFSKNLIEKDIEISTTGGDATYKNYTDDDPIIIAEGHPYLIRPYMPAGKKGFSTEKYTTNLEDYTDATHPHIVASEGSNLRIPYTGHVIEARDAQGNALSDWKYRFGGAYTTHPLPQYSYYLSHSKSAKKNKWFYLEGNKERTWNPYSAIIAANVKDTHFIPSSDEAKEGKLPNVTFAGVSDDFPTTKAKQYIMKIESGTTTGIQSVHQDDPVVYVDGHAYLTDPNVRIYKINGQYVGHRLEDLPEGIYIINGKKYLIK